VLPFYFSLEAVSFQLFAVGPPDCGRVGFEMQKPALGSTGFATDFRPLIQL
jgi:hypothetical protein